MELRLKAILNVGNSIAHYQGISYWFHISGNMNFISVHPNVDVGCVLQGDDGGAAELPVGDVLQQDENLQ